MFLEFEKLNPVYGVEVKNFNLSSDLNNHSFKEIINAFNNFGILLFRKQEISIENQVKLGRKFGEVQVHVVDQYHAKGHPEVYFLTNLDDDGNPTGNHPDQGSLYWHTDGSWRKRTGQATIMVADIIPKKGGETKFCCMENAYARLDNNTKEKILKLNAVHNLDFSRTRRHGHDPLSKKQKNKVPPVSHPIIRRHPETRRKSLFLGDHAEYIEGMDYDTGRKLIEDLNSRAIISELVYTHQYKSGDVIVWDNRRLLHKAMPYDTAREKRVMRRTTILGDVPN